MTASLPYMTHNNIPKVDQTSDLKSNPISYRKKQIKI